jgi:hypothetical protein
LSQFCSLREAPHFVQNADVSVSSTAPHEVHTRRGRAEREAGLFLPLRIASMLCAPLRRTNAARSNTLSLIAPRRRIDLLVPFKMTLCVGGSGGASGVETWCSDSGSTGGVVEAADISAGG